MSELTDRIRELQVLTSEIEEQRSWKLALSHIQEQIDMLDQAWQYQRDEKELWKMQVTKSGLLAVLGLLDDWKDELADLKTQLEAEENPTEIQEGDFDNEIIEE